MLQLPILPRTPIFPMAICYSFTGDAAFCLKAFNRCANALNRGSALTLFTAMFTARF